MENQSADILFRQIFKQYVKLYRSHIEDVLMKFFKIKAAAMQKQGNSFNLKEFHKYILDMGPVQFDILFENLPE